MCPVVSMRYTGAFEGLEIGTTMQTTVAIRQLCYLSPKRFNVCLQNIREETREDLAHHSQHNSNLRFAYVIDLMV